MSWTWKLLLGAAALTAAMLAPASAQVDPNDVRGPPATHNAPPNSGTSVVAPRPRQARYVVSPVKIYARDETHIDAVGSDEIFAVFRDPVSASDVKTTSFEGVNTGDTRYFAQAQACITPLGGGLAGENGQPIAWTCREGGVATVQFTVELYEDDDDSQPGRPSYYRDFYCTTEMAPANCEDDRLGRAVVNYSARRLARWMPQEGMTHDVTLRMDGYDFTFRIQRLNDVIIDPPNEIGH